MLIIRPSTRLQTSPDRICMYRASTIRSAFVSPMRSSRAASAAALVSGVTGEGGGVGEGERGGLGQGGGVVVVGPPPRHVHRQRSGLPPEQQVVQAVTEP